MANPVEVLAPHIAADRLKTLLDVAACLDDFAAAARGPPVQHTGPVFKLGSGFGAPPGPPFSALAPTAANIRGYAPPTADPGFGGFPGASAFNNGGAPPGLGAINGSAASAVPPPPAWPPGALNNPYGN